MNSTNKQWIILAVVAIVAIPWGVAWWVKNHTQALDLEPVAHGDLVTVEVESSDFDFQDKATREAYYLDKHWWMLVVQEGQQNACLNRLHDVHQIHTALAQDAERVKRAVVQVIPADIEDDSLLFPGDKGLVRLRMTPDQLMHFKEGVDNDNLDFEHGVVYVIDPLGNVVMAFNADVPPKDMLTDMKRLLRGSHIG